jgi:L-ascorbate metabolism protein UlaG (beta-lactamase superfamily)
MALWAGFVVETAAGKLYHVGDTGFHGGRNYRMAAERHGGFRLALLPIGAYAPRWFMEAQHQNPEEAVEGMLLANAAFAAGHHWGTFHLTNEPIGEPGERVRAALAERGIQGERFRALRPGEVWDVPSA